MNENKKTVVIGATPNTTRYGYFVVERLLNHKFPVIPIGIKKGNIAGLEIQQGTPKIENVHTVTLYVNPVIQKNYYDYILNELHPKRIIFNPGTENPEFEKLAKQKNIEVLESCTLVMLSVGTF